MTKPAARALAREAIGRSLMKPLTFWFSESSSRRASSICGPRRFCTCRAVSDSVSVVAIGRVSSVSLLGSSAAPDAQPQSRGEGEPQGDAWAASHPVANVPDVVQLASEGLGGVHHLGPRPLDLLAELGLALRLGTGDRHGRRSRAAWPLCSSGRGGASAWTRRSSSTDED